MNNTNKYKKNNQTTNKQLEQINSQTNKKKRKI